MKRIIHKLKEYKHKKSRYISPQNNLINFIDVGSVGVLPSPWDINSHLINKLLSFDPQKDDTSNPNVIRKNIALWESKQSKNFYIYKGFKQSGSSLFKQNYQFVMDNIKWLELRGDKELARTWFDRSELVETTKIKCDTLDNVLSDINNTKFHFLKVDAQGAEHNILKGSEKFLRTSCLGIHLELFTIPMYRGIGMFDDVAKYLKSFGFEISKVFPTHGTFLSQHDVLFLKKGINNKITKEIRKIYQIER